MRLVPASGHRIATNEKKKEVLMHIRIRIARIRPTNALLSLVRTIVSHLSIYPYGYIHMDIVPLRGAAFIPMPKGGAFRRER